MCTNKPWPIRSDLEYDRGPCQTQHVALTSMSRGQAGNRWPKLLFQNMDYCSTCMQFVHHHIHAEQKYVSPLDSSNVAICNMSLRLSAARSNFGLNQTQSPRPSSTEPWQLLNTCWVRTLQFLRTNSNRGSTTHSRKSMMNCPWLVDKTSGRVLIHDIINGLQPSEIGSR